MALGEIRRRPTLPGRFQPSTISVLRLNFCVRDGNRWIPQAIVTGNLLCKPLLLPPFLLPSVRPSNGLPTACFQDCPLLGFAPGVLTHRVSHPQNRTGWISVARLTLTGSLQSFDILSQTSLWFRDSFPVLRSSFRSRFRSCFSCSLFPLPCSLFPQDQALDRLVSPSSTHYCASTDDLSTLSSSRGLTLLLRWQFSSLGGLHA